LYTLTDIVRTRLRWLNLARKMPQALDWDALEILPRSAQRRRPRSRMPSIGARTRASASYALHRGPPSHPGVGDRRQGSLGRCRSGASADPGQLPVCCRTGQQGKQRARVLILLASHFPIVHRICDSISSLMGVVKFGLVAAVRPREIPTLRARTRRALQRRESPCLLAVGQIRRSPRAEDRLKGGQDSATHPAAVGWILWCVIALPCSAADRTGFPNGWPLVDENLHEASPLKPQTGNPKSDHNLVRALPWTRPSTGYPGATRDLSLTSFLLAQIQSKAVDRARDAPVAGRAHESPVLSTSGRRWIAVGPEEGAINRKRTSRKRHRPERQ